MKYIANSPVKNINLLESYMMVSILTMLGRFSECMCVVIAVFEVLIALVTFASMTLCSCQNLFGV